MDCRPRLSLSAIGCYRVNAQGRELSVAEGIAIVSEGRIPSLRGSLWEGQECARKPPFRSERELRFTAQRHTGIPIPLRAYAE